MCLDGPRLIHHLYGLKTEERHPGIRMFVQIWDKEYFRRVTVAVQDQFSDDSTRDFCVYG